MSIVATMNEAAGQHAARSRRLQRGVAEPAQSTLSAIAAGLMRYIPTEAVALYTAILPFLVPKETPLDQQDFTSRWWLAVGVGTAAILFAVGVYKREIETRGAIFRWPPRQTITVLIAYVGWVFMIPGSPLNTFDWYTPSLGAVVGIVVSFAITLFHLWFGGPEA
jgi:hypothetical protein